MNDPKLLAIWKQSQVPVIFRPTEGDLMVKLPYGDSNRVWLHEGRRSRPEWNPQHKCWLLPRSCFNELTHRVLERFETTYTVQPHNPGEACTASCQNARCLECECSCLGKNHGLGLGRERGYDLGESRPAQWGEKSYRWSLLRRQTPQARAA